MKKQHKVLVDNNWVTATWWGADWQAWSIGFDVCHDGLTLELLALSITITLHWVLHAPVMKAQERKAQVAVPLSLVPNDMTWLNQDVWTTRDGRTLKPSEMETNHLRNTIRMLERNAQKYLDDYILRYYVYGTTQLSGEYAQMAFDREWAQLMDQDPVQWLKRQTIYQVLVVELADREQESLDIRDEETPCGVDD